MLIDCNKWRKNNITEALLETYEKYQNIIQLADQDVLNKYFNNNYKILNNKYNWINQNFYLEGDSPILLRHFNGPIKPWQIHPDTKTDLLPNLKDFWKYAKITPFYNELLLKCQDKLKQNELIRKLRITNMHSKIISRLNRNN